MFDPRQIGLVGQTFNPGAMLFLYSPKQFGAQVIRPYMYNFNDNMVDKLMSGPSMVESLRRTDVLNSPDIAQAIRPEANGILLDTSVVSNAWTFLLCIDLAPKYMGGDIAALASPSRMICSGWCVDSPVLEYSLNWAEPVINENCLLNITHHTFVNFMDAANAMGVIPQTSVRMNNDLVDSSIDMMAPTHDTYLMTPGDVIQNVHMDSGSLTRVTTEGTAALANVKDQAACIQSVLKSPMHHLKEIVHNLGSAIDLENNQSLSTRSAMDNALGIDGDSLANVTTTFAANVPRATQMPYQQMAIDTTRPLAIGELHRMYPNIRVFPQVIHNTSQWDVIPQTEMSQKVVYSSMVSSAIGSIAAECGLIGVDFSYKSFVSSMDISSVNDRWEFRNAFLTVPNPDPAIAARQLEAAVTKFKVNIETSLFPVLKAASGDFELHARYDVSTETIVDLHFNDYSYSNEGRGFYEASNRLCQLNNPMIGTCDQFLSNGAELNKLIANCTGKAVLNDLGVPTFPNNMPGGNQAFGVNNTFSASGYSF